MENNTPRAFDLLAAYGIFPSAEFDCPSSGDKIMRKGFITIHAGYASDHVIVFEVPAFAGARITRDSLEREKKAGKLFLISKEDKT